MSYRYPVQTSRLHISSIFVSHFHPYDNHSTLRHINFLSVSFMWLLHAKVFSTTMNNNSWSLLKRSSLCPSPEKECCYTCGREEKAWQNLAHFPQCAADMERSGKDSGDQGRPRQHCKKSYPVSTDHITQFNIPMMSTWWSICSIRCIVNGLLAASFLLPPPLHIPWSVGTVVSPSYYPG